MIDNGQSSQPQSDFTPAPVDAGSYLEPWPLSVLVCPADLTPIRTDASNLVCDLCGRRYPVQDGIPVMMVNSAENERKF
jgi:uncharacterized protein YbaR (Trm112 family)